jgi:hypothetical protein
LEAFQRDTSAGQITTADTLTTLKNQQNTIESNYSTIEASLSATQQELSNVQTNGEIGKATEHELSELSTEVQTIRSSLDCWRESLSQRIDKREESLSRMIDFADLLSQEKQPQERMGMRVEVIETDLGRVASEVEVFRGSSQAFAELHTAVSALQNHIPLFIDSHINSTFPPLFEAFGGKQFSLLWRGNRDGFSAANFHSRCDGHANTLTLILDTNGNVFGGFPPLKWESPNSDSPKGNDSNEFDDEVCSPSRNSRKTEMKPKLSIIRPAT